MKSLSEQEKRAVCALSERGFSQRELARRFGVGKMTIARAIWGGRYADNAEKPNHNWRAMAEQRTRARREAKKYSDWVSQYAQIVGKDAALKALESNDEHVTQ